MPTTTTTQPPPSMIERARRALGGSYPNFHRVGGVLPTWTWAGFIVSQDGDNWIVDAPDRAPAILATEGDAWHHAYLAVAVHYEQRLAV